MKGIDDKAFRKWRGDTLPSYNNKQFKLFMLFLAVGAVAGAGGACIPL